MRLVTLEGKGGYDGLVLCLFEDRTGQMLGWITPVVPPQPDPIIG